MVKSYLKAEINALLTSAKDRLRRPPAPKQENFFEEDEE